MFYATHAFGFAEVPGTLTGNCGDNPGIACRLAWDITHSTNATQVVRVYLAGPISEALRILFVVVVALYYLAAPWNFIGRAAADVACCSAAHILYACTGSTRVSLVNTVNSTAG